jgi:phosphopantothenoylcysteine synthetase/decarboxylase
VKKEQRLALLVTGSIAAIKTIPLIGALRKKKFDVAVFLTRAPEVWKWVLVDEARAASKNDVLTESASWMDRGAALEAAKVILVAPASADFLSQLAHASSELARCVLEAQRRGSRLMIAPAMNYKMWHHPAVQRNCSALAHAGAVILGPAKGHMACGDDGFGRMIEVDDMAAGVRAALDGAAHPALDYYDAARLAENIPFCPPKETRVVVALGGGSISWPDVEKTVNDIKKAGMIADYVIDETWAGCRDALEKMTQQPVVTDYFQIPEMKGMEHIKLPERARCVFIPFLDDALATAMIEGKADTLFLGLYLASKAPLVTTKKSLQEISPSLAAVLRQDGLGVVGDIKELARYGKS